MRGVHHVVAVAQHDQHAVRRDPPRGEPEHVERGLVGPVEVFDDEHTRLVSSKLVDQCLSNPVRDGLTEKPLGELGSSVGAEVMDRAERSGREERIARAPQHPCAGAQLNAEPTDQCALAAARLSRDKRHTTSPSAGICKRCVKQRKLALTLDEHVSAGGRVGQQAQTSIAS
jgi:hypothetical protein